MEPLSIEGDIDMVTVNDVLAELLRQLRSRDLADGDAIEIDCSRVTYVGSHALRMFGQFRGTAHRHVVLVGLPRPLRRPFEISGLDQLFELR